MFFESVHCYGTHAFDPRILRILLNFSRDLSGVYVPVMVSGLWEPFESEKALMRLLFTNTAQTGLAISASILSSMRRTDTDLVDATAGPFATPPSVTPVSSAVLKMASSSSSSSAANYYMYACQQTSNPSGWRGIQCIHLRRQLMIPLHVNVVVLYYRSVEI